LSKRYSRGGNLNDLELAIAVGRKALRMMPLQLEFRRDETNKRRAHVLMYGSCLNNLSNRLRSRYERTGKMADLDDAIRYLRFACQFGDLAPQDYLASWLNNLATMIRNRYYRISHIPNLEEAVQIARDSVGKTPVGHKSRGTRLSNLGNHIQMLYERTGDVKYITEAIETARLGVSCCTPGTLDYAATLDNLATKLSWKAIKDEDVSAQEEAIRLSREAADILPPDHPEQASYLHNYARQLKLFRIEEKAELRRLWSQAWKSFNSPYVVRLQAARFLTDFLLDSNKLADAYDLSMEVIDFLPQIHNKSLTLHDQQFVATLFSGFATHACSLALHFKESPAKALDLLERGRGVMLSLMTDETKDRKAPTSEQMMCAAADGAIVVFNITTLRSDAIVVMDTEMKHFHLPNLGAARTQEWLQKNLTGGSPRERGTKNKAYRNFLTWLWKSGVKTIMDGLQYTFNADLTQLPRVWWIGTGLASFLPFHAAGDFSMGLAESALCRVISSHSPTIKSLIHTKARASRNIPGRALRNQLIVTMSKTPGEEDLPGVIEEAVAVVCATLEERAHVVALSQPNPEQVLREIDQCDAAHFACHGISHSYGPLWSGLILQESSTQQDVITVRDICESQHRHRELAYLSACSTAQSRSDGLVDEVLHVVSSFQVAGFNHVVGCLWPSDDAVCARIAASFYSTLNAGFISKHGDKAAPLAFQMAVLEIKLDKEYQKRPLDWAQYVHYGA
ncbi:hypothetical protein CC86DRAFT_246522, partial [Ophiobolus disseminans]